MENPHTQPSETSPDNLPTRYEALTRIIASLNTDRPVNNILEQIAAVLTRLIVCEKFRLILPPMRRRVCVKNNRFRSKETNGYFTDPDQDPSPIRWALDYKRPLLRPDIQSDRRFAGDEKRLREGRRSDLTIPLVFRGQVLAILYFSGRHPNQYTRDHIQAVRALEDTLTLAFRHLHDRLEREHPRTDALPAPHTAEQAQQQARLAAVGQLAAGIAHDFNNLLSVMTGIAQLLVMRDDIPDAVKDNLRNITFQGQRAANLIRQILDFSRKTVVKYQPVDLKPFLKETAKLLERTIPENVRIVVEFDREDHTVKASLTQLQHAVTNLVVNARDAMPEGGELRLALTRTGVKPEETPPLPGLRAGNWVILTVSDTGTGMTPETMSRIYEPFFTTKPPGRGTGLGLAQVYGIIKQHEGEIAVKSQVNQGTSFSIYLPAHRSIAKQTRTPETPPVRGNGETILIVEDRPEVLRVAGTLLQNLNYRVLTANDGRKALDVFAAHRDQIDVVLTDMVMPLMGGLELFKLLREQKPGIQAVLMTGYPLREHLTGRLPEGIVTCLIKPLSVHQLANGIQKALRRAHPRNPSPGGDPSGTAPAAPSDSPSPE